MFKLFAKVLFSTALITVFNFTTVFFASKYLSKDVFGFVIYLQAFVATVLNFSYLGVNFEILRYGSKNSYLGKGYRYSLRDFFRSNVLFASAVVVLFLTNENYSSPILLVIIFAVINVFYLIVVNGCMLRTLDSYVISNFYDKSLVVSFSFLYIFLLIGNSGVVNASVLLLFIVSIMLICSYRSLNYRCRLKQLFWLQANTIGGNVRYQLYASSVMFCIPNGLEKIFIGSHFSLEELALWYVYFQVFLPFTFIGRAFCQVAFSELARGKYYISRKSLIRLMGACFLFSIVVFGVTNILFKVYYGNKFNIESVNLALMSAVGFFYSMCMISQTLLGAIYDRRVNLINNYATGILCVVLVACYATISKYNFPTGMISCILLFWFAKTLINTMMIGFSRSISGGLISSLRGIND